MTAKEHWCYSCKSWKLPLSTWASGFGTRDLCPTCKNLLGFEKNKETNTPEFLREYGGLVETKKKDGFAQILD